MPIGINGVSRKKGDSLGLDGLPWSEFGGGNIKIEENYARVHN